jgi:hypothetical protein
MFVADFTYIPVLRFGSLFKGRSDAVQEDFIPEPAFASFDEIQIEVITLRAALRAMLAYLAGVEKRS